MFGVIERCRRVAISGQLLILFIYGGGGGGGIKGMSPRQKGGGCVEWSFES